MHANIDTGAAGEELAKATRKYIADLVHGNHASHADVKLISSNASRCYLKYSVEWHFSSKYSSETFSGNHARNLHYGFDYQGYQNETEKRMAAASSNIKIRSQFQNSILNKNNNGLVSAQQSIEIWNFGQHSVHTSCDNCNGSGKNRCRNCGSSGSVLCIYCAGQGFKMDYHYSRDSDGRVHTRAYKDNCPACIGGWQTCSDCSGTGVVSCRACDGHGYFTEITSVTAFANPHIFVSSQSDILQKTLQNHLIEAPLKSIFPAVDFFYEDNANTASNIWRVNYGAKSIVVETLIKINSEHYAIASLGVNNYYFYKPAIFDNLFASEISRAANKKSKNSINTKSTFKEFTQYPRLAEAMKLLARQQTTNANALAIPLTNSCHGFISSQAASLLGAQLEFVLNRISPQYSIVTWSILMAIPLFLIFLIAQNWFEIHHVSQSFEGFIVFIKAALLSTIALTVISPIAAASSSVVTFFKKILIDKPYRQKGRNWKPYKKFILLGILITWLGAFVGIATRNSLIPEWESNAVSTARNLAKPVLVFSNKHLEHLNQKIRGYYYSKFSKEI